MRLWNSDGNFIYLLSDQSKPIPSNQQQTRPFQETRPSYHALIESELLESESLLFKPDLFFSSFSNPSKFLLVCFCLILLSENESLLFKPNLFFFLEQFK
jgi:hypothetical protein